jgi:hypothetical protein
VTPSREFAGRVARTSGRRVVPRVVHGAAAGGLHFRVMKALIIALLGALSAQAAVITHTITVNPTVTDWRVTNGVPQFDASLGKLTAVSVSVSGSVSNVARFTSDSIFLWDVQFSATNTVRAVAGPLVAAVVSNPKVTVPNVRRGDERVAALGGTTSASAVQVANFGSWVGIGLVPVVTSVEVTTWYYGPGAGRLSQSSSGSAVVVVAYEFTPRCEEDGDKDKDGDKDSDKDGGGR